MGAATTSETAGRTEEAVKVKNKKRSEWHWCDLLPVEERRHNVVAGKEKVRVCLWGRGVKICVLYRQNKTVMACILLGISDSALMHL